MSRTTSIVLGAFVIAAVAWLVFAGQAQAPVREETIRQDTQEAGSALPAAATSSSSNEAPAPAGGAAPVGKTYAMAEVAAHNSAESCWSVVDGIVYDLTQWISKHPGGKRAIERMCGTDGTAGFRAQHGTAPRQQDILEGFEIGTLAK